MSATTAWRPTSDEDYDRLKGRLVVDVNGLPVGTLHAVFHPPTPQTEERRTHIFLIERDPGVTIFEHDALYVSEDHVQAIEDDLVRLDVPRDSLKGDLIRPPANIGSFRRR
ncbi:MAG: hypothetical protein QOF01_2284 [Thermomicrobiales bacterium]|jgi:hypothetical protein|nr:hypothetical protein [Thermomicrobiales bacterium]MEA2595815.1 hypothetical protein [Thermomicrobiales bacterium]